MRVTILSLAILILKTNSHIIIKSEVTTEVIQDDDLVFDKNSDDFKTSDQIVHQQTTVGDEVRKHNKNYLRTNNSSNEFPEIESTDKQLWTKTNNYDAKDVYLEDVVFALNNKNWTKDEEPCLNATLHLIRSLQNFTLWAVWDWDSISSQPQGLLFGNRYELGNFDECMNAPWEKTHPELLTQYCLAEIVLERTARHTTKRGQKLVKPYDSALDFIMRDKSMIYRPLNELTWGGCIPVSCGPRSVEKLMGTLLARSHLGTAGMRAHIDISEECQRPDQPRQFDGLFYGFCIFAAVLFATCLRCTYLNWKRDLGPKSLKDDIVQACCLRDNAKNLLVMKKEGSEVLYGIRFLSIVFIVMDHQIAMHNSGPIINGVQVDQATLSVAGMFVLHDDLFVDTFFVLSGFLTATALMKLQNKRFFNPLLLIVKRYLRLVVAYAIVVFYYVAIYPYTGSGPLWNRAVAAETTICKKNWWLSLLMLGNYIDNENICLVISWYIPCDFHFFVVTVLMFWLYKHKPRFAAITAGILATASLIAPGVINYWNSLPAIQLFTYDFVKNPRASDQFHILYIKSHARFPAYIVGIVAGCLFMIYKDKKIAMKWSILGTVSGVIIMTSVMVGGATYLWRDYHPLEGALYAALNRPIWACGVALVILCCCLGRVPLVEGFLTWYPWVPLSRLSYGLYLTHSAFISRNVYSTRSPQRNDLMTVLTLSGGVMIIGCVAALAIWLLAEAPINNLFVVLVKSKAKRLKPQSDNSERIQKTPPMLSTSSTSIASTSQSGHLHNNLPVTIEFSSKM